MYEEEKMAFVDVPSGGSDCNGNMGLWRGQGGSKFHVWSSAIDKSRHHH